MTNEEAIRIINGKAPLIMSDREGGICDKTDELKTTILSALEKPGKDCESDKYCNKCALFPDICHGFKADCQIGKVKK